MEFNTKQTVMDLASNEKNPVTCFGIEFSNDDERRNYFCDRLREYIENPEFRAQEGFPQGTVEDILKMSDPPYYTACPNPFFTEFLELYGAPYNPDEHYRRSPFVADVAVAKTDHLYKSHRYHTKVPYKAIAQYILHYTRPGDVILDGFSGTGMTGVAAEYVKNAEEEILRATGNQSKEEQLQNGTIESGARHALLVDLSPAATMLAASFNAEVEINSFATWATEQMEEFDDQYGWFYRCEHEGQEGVGKVTEYVWSEIFSCPECQGEVDFLRDACNQDARPLEEITCSHCSATLSKRQLEKRFQYRVDPLTGEQGAFPTRRLSRVHYRVGQRSFVREPIESDLNRIKLTEAIRPSAALPTVAIPYMHMTHERARMDKQGVSHYHHFYTPRMQVALSWLWDRLADAPDEATRRIGRFWLDSHFLNLSIQNCYRPGVSFPYNPISGIYYVSSVVSEPNPLIAYANKLKQLVRGFSGRSVRAGKYGVMTGSCAAIPIKNDSIDYIFTDPPFGENIYYSDLNFLVEAWVGVFTATEQEVIVDKAKSKGLLQYQDLMHSCFSEYYRVLKPGRWMTVVFSNSKASVWNAIQVALQAAGFVVAEVTALDKVQGSYRQLTSTTAVKQDLVISAYKPNGGLEQRFVEAGPTKDSAWDFTQTHLRNLAVTKRDKNGLLEAVAERDPRRIFDRLVAWFIRHNTPVPISSAEFQTEVINRFPERDGMIFLPHQADEYDRQRLAVGQPPQRDLFVDDERSAIDWLSDYLKTKPASYQEIHPDFTRQTGAGWRKHEEKPELARLLEDNFLQYDGSGPVPSQIHRYLSSNWKELRNLEKTDSALVEKGRARWYVPDPAKQQDVEKRRDKALMREFDRYRMHKGRKLKEVRLEAMRAGFKSAWALKEYQTIIDVAAKVQEDAWLEDEKLLMYFDMANTRLQAAK